MIGNSPYFVRGIREMTEEINIADESSRTSKSWPFSLEKSVQSAWVTFWLGLIYRRISRSCSHDNREAVTPPKALSRHRFGSASAFHPRSHSRYRSTRLHLASRTIGPHFRLLHFSSPLAIRAAMEMPPLRRFSTFAVDCAVDWMNPESSACIHIYKAKLTLSFIHTGDYHWSH